MPQVTDNREEKDLTHEERAALGLDEDEEEEDLFVQGRYLDLNACSAVTRGFKKNYKGYMGILNFSLFCCLYFSVLYTARNNTYLGLENRALRLPLQLLKPQNKVTTIPEFWGFFAGTVVPWLLDENVWEATVPPTAQHDPRPLWEHFNHSFETRGANAQQYSTIIGGIALLQTRSLRKKCPTNTNLWPPAGTKSVHCYSEEPDRVPFRVEGELLDEHSNLTSVSIEVRFLAEAGAYMTVLPVSATKEQLTAMIKFLADGGWVDQSVRSIRMMVPMYNPNTDTIGILSWGHEIDLAGHLHPDLTTVSIPYHLYGPDSTWFIVRQLVLLGWVMLMVKGLWVGYITTHPLPAWLQARYPAAKSTPGRGVMPADPVGRTLLLIPAVMFLSILCGVVLWVGLVMQFREMNAKTRFDARSAISLFEAGPSSIVTMVTQGAHPEVLELFVTIERVSASLDRFFYVAALSVVVIIFRMFHYLDFQGKLNAITVTVRTGIGELFHLLVVLNFVVTGFVVTGLTSV